MGNISAVATSLLLDPDAASLLRSRLGTDGYTYLLLSNAANYEVVKATAVVASVVTIERAKDGTTAAVFTMGDTVEFILGSDAVADIVSEKVLDEIQLVGEGAAVVTKIGVNSYSLYVPEITLVSSTTDILVGGEYPNFVISAPIKADCCA